MSLPVLGYWDVRGLCEPIRFLLYHAGADFEDKRYAVNKDGANMWYAGDRDNLGFDFPNLPYWIDGDVVVTQSIGILRHVARKYNLIGKPEDVVRLELAEQQADHMRVNMMAMVYNMESFETYKSIRLKGLPQDVEQFARFLGDRKFVAGNEVTYVDFLWYHTLDYYRQFDPESFEGQDTIAAYQLRIEQLPNIAKYMESSSYTKNIWAPFAKWPGKGEERQDWSSSA
ncbi:Glutathione S-transferase [Halotydeus destructor]|nr:Glutathione S-transferase [Halotydeus destructor]